MPKIKNPTLFSDYFKVDLQKMNDLEIFDPVINVDTNLFIDPLLLKKSKYEIVRTKALKQQSEKFGNIISLLLISTKENDFAWESALRILPKKEVEGTCLGYGTNSTSGRSITEEVRKTIIRTASEIIKIGIKDPDLFMLLPLFEEGIGPDSISDITTSLIEETLLEFTSEIAKELGIETEEYEYKNEVYSIIRNPLKRKISPIILLPQDILRHLPVVTSWTDVADAASFNSALRFRVNNMIANIFKAKTTYEKQNAKDAILRDKESLEKLLIVLKNGNISSYDFKRDNLSLMAWQNILTSLSDKHPFEIINVEVSEVGIIDCVKLIIEQFKFLVEHKGLNKLFWKNRNEPNKEKIVQMIFFAVAYNYCKANNIDVNPEMDTGNGNVDFKFSQGFDKRVIVEIKNSYNYNISSGFKTQLKTYKESEETCYGFYLIINVGNLGRKLDDLLKIYESDDDKKSEIYYVDARIKPSASKRK